LSLFFFFFTAKEKKRMASEEGVSSGVLNANGVTDPIILEQSRALLSSFGAAGRSLTLMPNAKRGEAFSPLSGYVLRVDKSAKVIARHVDVGTLLKGRCIIPVFNLDDKETAEALAEANIDAAGSIDRILEVITPEWLVNATHECFNEAYRIVNDAYHKGSANASGSTSSSRLMEVEPSESCQSSVSLVEIVRDAEPWLVCESHSLPKMWYIGDELARAEREGNTFQQFFFQEHMASYYRAQKAVRVITARLVRSRIVHQVLGEEVANKLRLVADPANIDTVNDSSNGASHFDTNVAVVDDATGELLFYSEAIEADMGALIYAGPFRELIWANRRQKSTRSIQSAKREQAVPFDLPPILRKVSAIESVVLAHTEASVKARKEYLRSVGRGDKDDNEEDEEDNDNDDADTRGSVITVDHDIKVAARIEHNPTVFSVRHAFIAGPSFVIDTVGAARARVARRAQCVLVWRESNLHIPVAVPDEALDYRRGVEVPAMLNILKAHGVELLGDSASANPTLRIAIQALAPVATLDQLVMWRASQSALMRPS
jgi:hypothetical protein